MSFEQTRSAYKLHPELVIRPVHTLCFCSCFLGLHFTLQSRPKVYTVNLSILHLQYTYSLYAKSVWKAKAVQLQRHERKSELPVEVVVAALD